MSKPCRLAALAMVATAGAVACAHPATTPPSAKPPSSAEATLATLLGYVPADTAAVVNVDPRLFEVPTFSFANQTPKLRAKLESALLEPAALAGAKLAARLSSELARELLPFDDAALARVGWRPGASGGALYGLGLVPVLRLRLDGARARAAVARVLDRARVTVVEARWEDVPYVVVPALGPTLPPLTIAFLPEQVVMALAADPAAVLPHLTRRAPLERSFGSTWRPRDAAPEGPADAIFWGMLLPGRAATLLGDPAARAQVGIPGTPCVGALARLLAATPALTATTWWDDREFVANYTFELGARNRQALATQGGIDHWLARRALPGAQVALGLGPATAMTLVADFLPALNGVGQTCVDEPKPPLTLPPLGPLELVHGATLVVELHGQAMGAGLVVTVRDVAAAWGWLATNVPIGTLPAPGEVRTVPLGPIELHLRVGRNALGLAFAPFEPDTFARLMDSEGRAELGAFELDAAMSRRFRDGLTIFGQPMPATPAEPNEPILGDTSATLHLDGARLRFVQRVDRRTTITP